MPSEYFDERYYNGDEDISESELSLRRDFDVTGKELESLTEFLSNICEHSDFEILALTNRNGMLASAFFLKNTLTSNKNRHKKFHLLYSSYLWDYKDVNGVIKNYVKKGWSDIEISGEMGKMSVAEAGIFLLIGALFKKADLKKLEIIIQFYAGEIRKRFNKKFLER